MLTIIPRRVTTLLILLTNLINLEEALGSSARAVTLLQPDSDGTVELHDGDIDVFTLPQNSLKDMRLTNVRLTWNSTNKPSHLEILEELDLQFCELNPNSITFSESFMSLTLYRSKFINGTLVDLLKSATHLQSLELSWMTDVKLIWDDSKPPLHLEWLEKIELYNCKFNPKTFTFSESLTSLTLFNIEFTNGTLIDIFKTVTNLIELDLGAMDKVNILELLLPPFQIFDDNLVSLEFQEIKFMNGTLRDVLNTATALQTLVLEKSGELDLSKLNLQQSTQIPQFLGNLTYFTISETKLVHGTLHDLLKNSRRLEVLQIKNMDKLDISNWHFNKLDNSSHQFFSLPEDCTEFYIENTQLSNGSLNDLLKNVKNLKNLRIDGIGQVNFSERGDLNNHNAELFGKLTYFRIVNTTLIGTTLHDVLKATNKIERLEFEQILDFDLSTLSSLQIWKKLVTLSIGQTHFVNGNLYDLFKLTTNVKTLTIDIMGKIDISQIYGDKLESLELKRVTITRTRPSEILRFQNLRELYISQSDAEDSKTLFRNFDQIFPIIVKINTGSQMIVHPTALNILMNSSAMVLEFSFDFDPPVKTYEFGTAMKNLIAAGYIRGEYADHLYEYVNVVQRVHLISLRREKFPSGAISKWYVYADFTGYGTYSGTMDDIKPMETKAVIYSYFLILLVFIVIGTTGNVFSAIALFKTKMENSAGAILLALTFFDSGVILTYLASAYFNAEIFYRMFVMTGPKSTEYSVDEHLWLNEQHSVLAFFIYPLNKTAYTASVYTTVLISLERFIAICWPLKSKYLLHRRNSIRAIMTILLFSVLLNLPRWIESYEWNYYTENSPNWNDYYKPTLMRMENYRTIYHGWIWATFMYILPFLLVAIFNVKIFRQTKLSLQLRPTLQSGLEEQPTNMSSLTRMLLSVVAVFVLCNSVHIAIVFYFLATYEQIQLSTAEAVSCLPIVINCSVNFLIYVLLGKTLRAQLLKILPERARHFCLACIRTDNTSNH